MDCTNWKEETAVVFAADHTQLRHVNVILFFLIFSELQSYIWHGNHLTGKRVLGNSQVLEPL
jgi:hypothetical protein